MDDIRGFIQGAANPFVTGFQGLGVEAIADSAVNPVTDATAQQTLQGINNLGKLSPEAQLAAASTLQDSAFAVKDGINSAKQWADAHPNITATAQTALSGAEAAGTVWVGKKVEVNPTKWDWVRNTSYETPTTRPMQTLDGEMAGGNKPVKPPVEPIRPTTRDELRQALQEQGFRRTGSDTAQYETWKGPDGVKIDIRPNGEVIRTQRVPRTDGVQGKYPQRQDYEGNPLPNNNHNSGYFVK